MGANAVYRGAGLDGYDFTCDEVKTMTLKHADDMHRKIADLKRMEKTLRDTAAQCEGGKTPDCPIIDSLFDGK